MTHGMSATDHSDVREALSVEGARRLIAEKHQVVVGENDPILMAVTLHRAFMLDVEAMLKRLNVQMAADVAGTIAKLQEEAAAASQQLRDDLIKGASQSVIAGVAEQATRFGQFKQLVRSHLIALSCFTAANWLAVVAFFFILK